MQQSKNIKSCQPSISDRQQAMTNLAQDLVAVLGYEGALLACKRNGWIGVRKELMKSGNRPAASRH